ncbi:hypothetical protein DEIPH_ctg013orf0017 [Deinococcus phoenicis]|uniref:VRR-NUC domain-containing protein n=1 Tax=Deinococcus phoenicis TaxID=1476583 RepID=A0A016QSZ2_9DEIO|nr:VRR-NUC domain-containing protein [Deinococcus phoenicis]EYB68914.1 hypothetical protein DEIPH_ctg013orf0017 [Deinococcus phoenicis]
MTRCVSKQDGEALESTIQAQIVQALKAQDFIVWEMFKGSARGGQVWATKGIPDLYVFRSGRAVWLEVKRPRTGKLSPAQRERHHELTICGLPVHVVTSPEEALAVLGIRVVGLLKGHR